MTQCAGGSVFASQQGGALERSAIVRPVSDVTRILGRAEQGGARSAEELLPLVYEELLSDPGSDLENRLIDCCLGDQRPVPGLLPAHFHPRAVASKKAAELRFLYPCQRPMAILSREGPHIRYDKGRLPEHGIVHIRSDVHAFPPASVLPLSREQITGLLRSLDRSTAVGRRDFAITLCMTQLGWRIGRQLSHHPQSAGRTRSPDAQRSRPRSLLGQARVFGPTGLRPASSTVKHGGRGVTFSFATSSTRASYKSVHICVQSVPPDRRSSFQNTPPLSFWSPRHAASTVRSWIVFDHGRETWI